MKQSTQTSSGRPFNLHERLLLYACDVVRAVEFLHKRGPIRRALSYQILSAGRSVGSNYEESDGASSTADFIAKNRIALKEAKEVRFRCGYAASQTCSTQSLTHYCASLTRLWGYSENSFTTHCGARQTRTSMIRIEPGC